MVGDVGSFCFDGLGRRRGGCFAFFEDGVDCFSSGFEEAGVGGVESGCRVEGSAVCVGVGAWLGAWVGGACAVAFCQFGGLCDEVARGGERLGVELIADGFPASFVDGGGVREGLLELV